MNEQKLEIVQNGQWKNIRLKPQPLKGIKGIDNDNYIIVEKQFKDGQEINGKFGKSYSCKALYLGEEVSFFLNEKEHAVFSSLGDAGSKVKITLKKESFINPKSGVEQIINKLYFDTV